LFDNSFRVAVFDCDSTLSRIEGIDELARLAGKFEAVEELTKKAMDGEIPLEQVFQKRLKIINPSREQIEKLVKLYTKNAVEDAKQTVESLRKNGIEVFVVSGGYSEPVKKFAWRLGIRKKNVLAVPLFFDQLSGNWWNYSDFENGKKQEFIGFDKKSPLWKSEGKIEMIKSIGAKPEEIIYTGDGSSDLEVKNQVGLFAGYGGVEKRENVKKESDVYINCESLAPFYAIALGQEKLKKAVEGGDLLAKKGTRLAIEQVDFSGKAIKIRSHLNSLLKVKQDD